jgi:hypothetical protein
MEQFFNRQASQREAMPFPECSQASSRRRNGFINRPFVRQARPQSIKGLIECLVSSVSQSGIDGLYEHLFRKCCNFENVDGGRPARNWAARSQAASSNSWSMN